MSKGRQRFSRSAMCAIDSNASKVFKKYTNPTDEARLAKTLDLVDTEEVKPSINGVMPIIEERLDEEARIAEMEYARRVVGGWSRNMIYDCMGEDDYPIECLTPKQLKKLNKRLYGENCGKGKKSSGKRGSRGKKKHDYDYIGGYDEYDDFWENRGSMYTNGEWDDSIDDETYESSYKSIKYYPDITNEMSVIEFHSLKEFSEYCDEHGYTVGTTDFSNLKNWSVIHCCLDPIDLEYGDYAIITDSSYGGLYWTVEADINKEESLKESESGVESN